MARPPALTQEQVDLVEKFVKAEYTLDDIAKELDVPRSTVQAYVERARKKAQEAEEIETTFVKRERSPERLISLVEAIPGIGEAKLGLARMMIKQNPALLNNPQELYAFCINALNLTDYPSQFVVKSFFADYFANPQAAPALLFPMGAGQAPGAQFPQYAPSQAAYQTVQTPSGPVMVPAPSSQQPLTASQVQAMLEESREAEYVEEHRPVLNPVTNQPVIGPDGKPLFTTVRRPANQQDPMAQMMGFFQMMKLMQDINGGGAGSVQQQITAAVQQALGQRPAGVDPQIQHLLTQMQIENAKTQAQLAAMQAVKERDEHWTKQLWDAKQGEAEARQRMQIAQAGMSASDQVSLKVVEGGTNAVAKAMDNMEKRMERIERAAGPILKTVMQAPPPPGQPTSLSDQELQQLANQGGQTPQG